MAHINITRDEEGTLTMERAGAPIELMGMVEYLKMDIEYEFVKMIRLQDAKRKAEKEREKHEEESNNG